MKTFYFFIFYTLIMSTSLIGKGVITLSPQSENIKPNSEFYVDIKANDLPLVYGAHLELAFDYQYLQPVDADPKKEGIQIENGNFFDTSNFFTLFNKSEEGQVKYVVSQVNPAEEISGEGRIARLHLRSTDKEGDVTISLLASSFGTRDGRTLDIARGEDLQISVNHKHEDLQKIQAKNNSRGLIYLSWIILVLILLIIAKHFYRKYKQSKKKNSE